VREHIQVLNSAPSHNDIQLFIKDLLCIYIGRGLQIKSHVIWIHLWKTYKFKKAFF